MKVIGLTGTIGSGKSKAAEFLAELGAKHISADQLAREALAQPGVLDAISRCFGAGVILPNGALDRAALGKLVFTDSRARKDLEAIIHPLVRNLFRQHLAEIPPETALVVYEIPLLFESDLPYPELEKIVVVDAPRDLSVTRIMARDHCSREMAEQKLAAQMPGKEKAALADIVIENSGSIAALRERVVRLYAQLLDAA